MINHMPVDIRWIIEVRVRLSGETVDSYIPYMPGLGTSTYAKKRRAKQLGVCYKYARMTCNTRCRTLGMVSNNHEDKIKFIRNGMSKETLDDISSSLERTVDMCILQFANYIHNSRKNNNNTVLGI